MRTSRPTRDLKLFLPVASLCAGALLLGRLPEQQGLAGHQKLMRTDWRNYQPARLSTQTTQWRVFTHEVGIVFGVVSTTGAARRA
jgi:hypothetical protein